jgi:hypothetical protein
MINKFNEGTVELFKRVLTNTENKIYWDNFKIENPLNKTKYNGTAYEVVSKEGKQIFRVSRIYGAEHYNLSVDKKEFVASEKEIIALYNLTQDMFKQREPKSMIASEKQEQEAQKQLDFLTKFQEGGRG